jgi:hypothetical protein
MAVVLLSWFANLLGQQSTLPSGSEFAAQFPTDKKDGHVAPVLAVLTPLIGKPREVMLLGVADYQNPTSLYTHQINVRSEDNSSEVSFWFDTIKEMREFSTSDFMVVLKNGATRRVMWTGAGCQGEPNSAWRCSYAGIANPDGTREVVDLTRIRRIEVR